MKIFVVVVKVKEGEEYSYFVDHVFAKKEKAHNHIRELAEYWADSKSDILDFLDHNSYERVQVFTKNGYRVYFCVEEVLED